MSVNPVTKSAPSQGALALLSEYAAKTRDAVLAGQTPQKPRETEVAAVRTVSAASPVTTNLRPDQMVAGIADSRRNRTTTPSPADTGASGGTASAYGEGGELDVRL
jgi:hypothetical protein